MEDVFFLTEALQISNTVVKMCVFYYTAEVHRECVRVHARHKSVGIELQSMQRLTMGSVY